MSEQLYQWVVYLHPTKEERDAGERTQVVAGPSSWELGTEKEMSMRAIRALRPDMLDNADRLEVAVRPFDGKCGTADSMPRALGKVFSTTPWDPPRYADGAVGPVGAMGPPGPPGEAVFDLAGWPGNASTKYRVSDLI